MAKTIVANEYIDDSLMPAGRIKEKVEGVTNMNEMVAVLIPTTGRAKQMLERVTDLLEQSYPVGDPPFVYLAIPENDKKTLAAAEDLPPIRFIVKRPAKTTAVEGWNLAYAAAYADFADWFVLGADDIVWHPGWLAAALACAEKNKAQVIGLNDGHTNLRHYGAHYMVHRDFIKKHMGGVFIPPAYKSWWFDREICEKAHGLGLYAAAHDATAEHLHPEWGTAEMDDTYELGYPLHDEDRDLYQARKAAGFPVDYELAEAEDDDPKSLKASENKMLVTGSDKATKKGKK